MNLLNDKQWEACSHTEGPLLILAGAGSGKTRVIVHRISYLIDDMDVNPYNILAITFTNKAAAEMRDRVEAQVGIGAENIWISTFHSMCVRILRRFYDRIGGNNNFTIYDTDDQKTVVKEVLKSLNIDNKQYPEKLCLAYISKAKEEFKTPEDMDLAAGSSYRDMQMARIYREYQERMKKNNALDFDDLIFKTLVLFDRDKEVLEMYQTRFKYIMVDEYQDTNNSQFLLIKFLAAKWRNLCVVGDDDQSIYKFRGANIYNILNFEEQYPDAMVVKLEQNYRSTSNILNAANAVVAHNEGRKAKKLWTDKDEGARIRYITYSTEYEEAHGVVNIILDKTLQGYSLSDMAVLYRTNAQSRALEEKFIYANVPYKLVGATNFYGRKEIRDIVAYLKTIANHDDEVSFARIINVPRRGIGLTTINKIRENAFDHGLSMYDYCKDPDLREELGRAKDKVASFIELMESFNSFAQSGDLVELFDSIMEKTGYKNELINEGTDEAKTRVENIEELKNKVASYEEEAMEPSLIELLEEISLVADESESDDDENKVTLMTLHSAKGLEFPLVFIVGMEERLFPSGMSIDSDDPDAVEEERRLCYVGITRAMKELYLSSASTRMINGNRTYPAQSRFIEEIPKDYLESSGVKMHTYSDSSDSFFGGSRIPQATFKSPKVPQAAFKTSKVPQNDLDSINYTVGDTVKHIKFGKGVVTEMIKGGNDYEITVVFDSVGEKKMFATLARLKKI
ncbi:MAG: UvrD-helicase domain-containing protein [Eubacterium sp.]|nr:UvrD-helicase domain-containing protein [Eubacterium sp.]